MISTSVFLPCTIISSVHKSLERPWRSVLHQSWRHELVGESSLSSDVFVHKRLQKLVSRSGVNLMDIKTSRSCKEE